MEVVTWQLLYEDCSRVQVNPTLCSKAFFNKTHCLLSLKRFSIVIMEKLKNIKSQGQRKWERRLLRGLMIFWETESGLKHVL